MKGYLFIIFLFVANHTYAQKQANNWVFGFNGGIDFSNEDIEVFRSEVETVSSTAVISDPQTGDLLFYFDGNTVWNRNHKMMLNGDSLLGSQAIIQSTIIVQVPNDNNKYYLFHMHGLNPSGVKFDSSYLSTLYYSIVDMTIDKGFGGIEESFKNINLWDSLSQKITAIQFANKAGYWLITHEIWNDNFYVTPITENGIGEPQVQPIGQFYESNKNILETGVIKASPNGKMIAVSSLDRNIDDRPGDQVRYFELFDFDPATGIISNPRNLGHFVFQSGVSFSPDNSKLYLNGGGPVDKTEPVDWIHQFDLSAENIISSRIGLLQHNPYFDDYSWVFGSFEIAPNGKIYLGGGASGNLGDGIFNEITVINNPNAKGFDADLETIQLPFANNQRVSFGLPNFIQDVFNNITPSDNPNLPCSFESFRIYPNPTSEYISVAIPERCFQPFNVVISNSLGQEVTQFEITYRESKMNIDFLAEGVYNAIIHFANSASTKRFIKTSERKSF